MSNRSNRSSRHGKHNARHDRSSKSNRVAVVPIYRDEIDVEKLGRAVLRMALRIGDAERELKEARRYGIDIDADTDCEDDI